MLFGLTQIAGQTFTVALLGVVISMISSMAFNDGRSLQRLITAGWMVAVAAAAVTLGAVLAPYTVAGDAAFVVIMATATTARRFGPRATSLGMVGFMTYFFAIFLGATISLLPWLIAALAIGTAISFGMSLLLRVRSDRQLRRVLGSLQSRLGLVLDVIADGLATGRWTDRDRRKLSQRVTRVNETILMIDGGLRDLGSRDLPGRTSADALAVRLFDVELATEHLSGAWNRAATGGAAAGLPPRARTNLVKAVAGLRAALRQPARVDGLADVQALTDRAGSSVPDAPMWQVLARAVRGLAETVERIRTHAIPEVTRPSGQSTPANQAGVASAPAGSEEAHVSSARLSPGNRQVIQVTIASSLAIVAGELLSPARWYWAVIAAFVIYSGTTSRGQTLARGWQRIAGTVAGVAIGAVVASLAGGNVAASLVLIFVSLFIGFYLMKISYAFMVTGMSTMLALLYGLLGEFTIGLLVTRIEETAVGAAIGIATAILVLPTSTSATAGGDVRAFLERLGELVSLAGQRFAGDCDKDLLGVARDLDRDLTALHASAKPFITGITSLRSRGSVSRTLTIFDACDHYARGLARVSRHTSDQASQDLLQRLTGHVRDTANALAAATGHGLPPPRQTVAELVDAAQATIGSHTSPPGERQALDLAVRYLRQLDFALVKLSRNVHPHVLDQEG